MKTRRGSHYQKDKRTNVLAVNAEQFRPYVERIYSYAECWAELMELELTGRRVDPDNQQAMADFFGKYAEVFSRRADTDGITGYMYGAAAITLAKYWEYGEPFRRWHNLNTQIGKEGEAANRNGGVLNPALLRLGTGK